LSTNSGKRGRKIRLKKGKEKSGNAKRENEKPENVTERKHVDANRLHCKQGM